MPTNDITTTQQTRRSSPSDLSSPFRVMKLGETLKYSGLGAITAPITGHYAPLRHVTPITPVTFITSITPTEREAARSSERLLPDWSNARNGSNDGNARNAT